MVYGLGGALALALISLAAARYLTSPAWVDALVVTGGSLGLAAAFALGLALRRALGRERWLAPASLALALAAALGRAQLLARVTAERGPVSIDFARLALAASTVLWGAVALLWGTQALGDAIDARRRGAAVASGLAVAAALYAVAPLLYMLGLRVNHWTVLGLFGLSVVAYGAGRLVRRWRRGTEHGD